MNNHYITNAQLDELQDGPTNTANASDVKNPLLTLDNKLHEVETASLGLDGVRLEEQSVIPTGETGVVKLYAKADGKVYARDAANNEYDLTGGGTVNNVSGFETTIIPETAFSGTSNSVQIDVNTSHRIIRLWVDARIDVTNLTTTLEILINDTMGTQLRRVALGGAVFGEGSANRQPALVLLEIVHPNLTNGTIHYSYKFYHTNGIIGEGVGSIDTTGNSIGNITLENSRDENFTTNGSYAMSGLY